MSEWQGEQINSPTQTPPGNTPKIFTLSVNPGFFATERIAIYDDGRDIYYSEIKGY